MRILTYNILDGGINRESLILKILQATSPDIVMLQEVFGSTPLADFAAQLNMRYFLARGNSRRHLALLSRFPIVEACAYRPFPPSSKSTLYVKLEYKPSRFIHTFGIHLFPHPFIAFELWRSWEKEIALRKAKSFVSEPCFLAGDFNATAPGDKPDTNSWPRLLNLMLVLQGGRLFHFAIRDILSKGFVDCYRSMHPETPGYTVPTKLPTIRLDYIFANQILYSGLTACDIVQNLPESHEASDHYPLLAEFDI